MNITEAVVVRPTPAAPPRVRNPMWIAITGIANPKVTALAKE